MRVFSKKMFKEKIYQKCLKRKFSINILKRKKIFEIYFLRRKYSKGFPQNLSEEISQIFSKNFEKRFFFFNFLKKILIKTKFLKLDFKRENFPNMILRENIQKYF